MQLPRDLPGNPASAVYGTIVVAGQLMVEGGSSHSVGRILGSLAAALVVFWLAHAYTDTLGGVITGGARNADTAPPSLRHALRVEWPIVESGIAPAAVLGLAWLVGASPHAATWAGAVVAAIELVGWALLAARRAEARGPRLVAFVVTAAVFGGVLVVAKYLIH
ncbi:hypothetical protein [uncultured Jatrophihabitans sp.]|uniref:hypothetical protein n=1 Tax=uncultured Jatrophihabitans sp. TaxID=1610747 RepID=UPI0035CAAD2E